MGHIFKILGIVVEFLDYEEHTNEEAYAYVQHISKSSTYKDRLPEIERLYISFEDEDAILEVVMKSRPFERLRRITGYLVGSTDRWNDGKTAELKDRVVHSSEG